MRQLRVCIVGLNYGYKVIYPLVKKNKALKLVGVCSQSINIKKNIFNEKKINFSSSWKYLILKTKPDLVFIATEPKVQEKILPYLINKKIFFFVEKPIGTNYNLIKLLFSQYKKKTNLYSAVDFNFISLPIFKFLKKNIKISSIKKYHIEWFFAGKLKKNISKSWRFSESLGGGTINNYCSHIFSIIDFYFGETEKILSAFSNKKYDIYKKVSIKTSHSNKVKGSISLDPQLSSKRKFMIKIFLENEIYELINNSYDYHNNFFLYLTKDNEKKLIKTYKIYSDKDSRIFPTDEIIKI